MTNNKKDFINTLYYGDNLEILKDKIESNMVDLIYLDPPFQSGKNYNIIFKTENIVKADAQIKTFKDTWSWGEEAENEYRGLIKSELTKEPPNIKTIELIKAMRNYLGECSMMAYLTMMAPRLLEMKRVLKDTGSIYLHCDSTASHYLKLLMDAIFGTNNFRNEIIWYYYNRWTAGKNDFQRLHDIIFRYTKTDEFKFNVQYQSYSKSMEEGFKKRGFVKRSSPKKGDYISTKKEGVAMHDVWQISFIHSQSKERLGYPTQKPEALLERIINASSTEGDLILDPFCGCGTTIAVAEKTHRRWIGIDITYLAIDVIKKRLDQTGSGIYYQIDGEPKDLYSAEKLAEKNPFQFQIWCVSKLNGIPSQIKTGDKGVDGIIYYENILKKDKTGKAIISVKGTKIVNPEMVRELKGTVESQHADFGILVVLQNPTKGMGIEAIKEPQIEYGVGKKIPKIQIISVEEILNKKADAKLPVYIFPWHKTMKGITKVSRDLFEDKNHGE